ncbi:hypothetical protein ACK8P5_25810 (plasmid) [Paenibacillus sp. EC2-1]|uniref:hypothetical protein n=1 Tax=Paenibacillus sp. EC2-1 TaxID=3388665 RepID=UPI003BEEBFC0
MTIMPQIISNQDAENLRLYTGLGVAGVGLGAATVMYSNSAKPKPKPQKKPKGPQPIPFDAKTHTGVMVGIDNGFDSDMYDLAVKMNDVTEMNRYQADAKKKWEALSPDRQASYDGFIRDPLDGHGRKPRPKWKQTVAKAVKRL